MSGTLYLVATPIGNLGDLSPRGVQTLQEADFIAAEDTRVSMKLLNHFDIKKPLVSYHEHNRAAAGQAILARLLRSGGRFCLCQRPQRLAEVFAALRGAGLEPKRLRLVQHDAVGAPGLVLLECRRGGKPGLRAEPTLLLYGPDGRETTEHRRAIPQA